MPSFQDANPPTCPSIPKQDATATIHIEALAGFSFARISAARRRCTSGWKDGSLESWGHEWKGTYGAQLRNPTPRNETLAETRRLVGIDRGIESRQGF